MSVLPSRGVHYLYAEYRAFENGSPGKHVLIVSHREPWLTLHRRTPEGSWSIIEARNGGGVKLESVSATLNVDEVYTDI